VGTRAPGAPGERQAAAIGLYSGAMKMPPLYRSASTARKGPGSYIVGPEGLSGLLHIFHFSICVRLSWGGYPPVWYHASRRERGTIVVLSCYRRATVLIPV